MRYIQDKTPYCPHWDEMEPCPNCYWAEPGTYKCRIYVMLKDNKVFDRVIANDKK